MASFFQKQFTKGNKEVYADRGERVAKQMTNASEAYIKSLNDKVFSAEMALDEMLDFSKTNTTSLDVKTPASYDAFVQNLNKKKVELELLRQELDIATETHNEFFADEEEEKPKRGRSTKKTTED